MALLLPCALLLEGAPSRIGFTGALPLGYVGPIATALAYWAIVEAGSHLREHDGDGVARNTTSRQRDLRLRAA
jgi:hypothetical protein